MNNCFTGKYISFKANLDFSVHCPHVVPEASLQVEPSIALLARVVPYAQVDALLVRLDLSFGPETLPARLADEVLVVLFV